MRGLYVHIPFCVQKCHYCNFVISTGSDRTTFLKFLQKEALHYRETFQLGPLNTLYLGGGTPSILSQEETAKLFSILQNHFELGPVLEMTLEANPRDVTQAKARLWKRLGVNRVSLGVQSFWDETLRRLNRDHDRKTILEAVAFLKEAGLDNLSFDLMLSLPGENLDQVRFSLEESVRLGAKHISLYELVIENKTMFAFWAKKGKLSLPPEDAQLAMLRWAREFLKSQAYIHYELLSYAQPGFESRHNRIYWDNEEYLGLGPGAFSYLGGRRFRNSESYPQYTQKIEQGDWSAVEEEALSEEKKQIESLLLALRLREGASLARFKPLLSKIGGPVDRLKAQGLLSQDAERLFLTSQGQLFAETVFTELSTPDNARMPLW